MTVRAFLTGLVRWTAFALLGVAVLVGVLLVAWSLRPPTSTLMLARSLTGARVERVWRPLGEIDRRLVTAVVASEDNAFCTHAGIDWAELREVVADDDGPKRGGSTITMQVAKNLFLWNGRSYLRKGLELPLALLVDLVWSKAHILEIYLNIAEWGPEGEFGIEAGTRRAFGHGADRIPAREAALLAVTLPNPHRRFPGKPAPGLRRVAGIIAARAAKSPELVDCIPK